MPGLDQSNTEPAYLLGRLMSVYEDTQYAAATADGGHAPNATFVDKYLAGAITSPRLVLTAGGRQAPAWLSKLRRNNRGWFHQREIDAIIALLDPSDPGPIRATLDQQALFLLGYHHQRAHSSAARTAAAVERATASAQSDGSTVTPPSQP
jgi:CRISPR-associated protein Csd1